MANNAHSRERKSLKNWFKKRGLKRPCEGIEGFWASNDLLKFYKEKKEKEMSSTATACASVPAGTYIQGIYSDCAASITYAKPYKVSSFDLESPVYIETTASGLNRQTPCAAIKKQEQFPINGNTETNMYVDARMTTDLNQKQYLADRLSKTFTTKKEAMKTTFGLVDDKAPKTPKELAERIKAGLFTMPCYANDEAEFGDWCSPRDLVGYFTWRDPAVKKDEDGFKKAIADLSTAKDKALDLIMVKDAEAGLTALEAFQSA